MFLNLVYEKNLKRESVYGYSLNPSLGYPVMLLGIIDLIDEAVKT